MPALATRPSLATDLRIAVNRLSRTLRNQKADTTVTDAQFSASHDSIATGR